jgi:hypothetical protein
MALCSLSTRAALPLPDFFPQVETFEGKGPLGVLPEQRVHWRCGQADCHWLLSGQEDDPSAPLSARPVQINTRPTGVEVGPSRQHAAAF